MNWKINEETGNKEFDFIAELVDIKTGDPLTNSNDKAYRPCTIKLPNGVAVSGIMNEKNYEYGVEPGITYRCRAIQFDDQDEPFISVSHLVAAMRATTKTLEDAFGGIEEPSKKEDKVDAKVDTAVGA